MTIYCSFCDRPEGDVDQILVRSFDISGISICNICVDVCVEAIQTNRAEHNRNKLAEQIFSELWGTD